MMDAGQVFDLLVESIPMDSLSELHYVNEFTFAVAVILSAQATDKKVNEATAGLFAVADSPEKMLGLGESGLKEHIKIISFFNNKARSILGLSAALVERGGTLPRVRDELMKLPGIGGKTAAVIMNVLWGAPIIGVDTHVFRLAHRFGWAGDGDNTPERVEARLYEVIPEKYWSIVNNCLVMHGRYVCTALRPKCDGCVLQSICEFYKNQIKTGGGK